MTNWNSIDEKKENGYARLKQRIKVRGGQCARCPSVKDITIDHIIPQQFLNILGFIDAYKEADNLQLLCKSCNLNKGNQLDYTNSRTIPLLEHYVMRWVDKHTKLNTRKITARCLCAGCIDDKDF